MRRPSDVNFPGVTAPPANDIADIFSGSADALFFQSFYDRGGKLFSGFKGCEAPNTRQSFKLVVREEMIELISPCDREDRIMLLPKNCCGRRKTVRIGTPEFPLSDVPLQSIAEKVAAGRYKAKPSRVFRFEDIREAHRVMESGEAVGKLVVRL
jgi:hypothetical protein